MHKYYQLFRKKNILESKARSKAIRLMISTVLPPFAPVYLRLNLLEIRSETPIEALNDVHFPWERFGREIKKKTRTLEADHLLAGPAAVARSLRINELIHKPPIRRVLRFLKPRKAWLVPDDNLTSIWRDRGWGKTHSIWYTLPKSAFNRAEILHPSITRCDKT